MKKKDLQQICQDEILYIHCCSFQLMKSHLKYLWFILQPLWVCWRNIFREQYISQISSDKFSKCPKLSLVRETPFQLEQQLQFCGKFSVNQLLRKFEEMGKARSNTCTTYSNSMILHHSSVPVCTYYTFADTFSSFSLSEKTEFSHTHEPHGSGAGGEEDCNRLQWTTMPLKSFLWRA